MQSQHKINRSVSVDAINDKCANFRRKRNTNTSVNDISCNAVVNECLQLDSFAFFLFAFLHVFFCFFSPGAVTLYDYLTFSDNNVVMDIN